jgi:hypothetical protein
MLPMALLHEDMAPWPVQVLDESLSLNEPCYTDKTVLCTIYTDSDTYHSLEETNKTAIDLVSTDILLTEPLTVTEPECSQGKVLQTASADSKEVMEVLLERYSIVEALTPTTEAMFTAQTVTTHLLLTSKKMFTTGAIQLNSQTVRAYCHVLSTALLRKEGGLTRPYCVPSLTTARRSITGYQHMLWQQMTKHSLPLASCPPTLVPQYHRPLHTCKALWQDEHRSRSFHCRRRI